MSETAPKSPDVLDPQQRRTLLESLSSELVAAVTPRINPKAKIEALILNTANEMPSGYDYVRIQSPLGKLEPDPETIKRTVEKQLKTLAQLMEGLNFVKKEVSTSPADVGNWESTEHGITVTTTNFDGAVDDYKVQLEGSPVDFVFEAGSHISVGTGKGEGLLHEHFTIKPETPVWWERLEKHFGLSPNETIWSGSDESAAS